MKKRQKNSPSEVHYTLFLGCTVPVRAANYELSARKVAERLDVQLHDIPEFACCGYPIKSVNHYAYLLMAARNLALAEEKGSSPLHPLQRLLWRPDRGQSRNPGGRKASKKDQ